MNRQLAELPVVTREGIFVAHYSESGLARLDFPNANDPKFGVRSSEFGVSNSASSGRLRAGQRSSPAWASGKNPSGPASARIHRWHRATTAALKAVLAGRLANRLPPLDWTGKTEFQQAVWTELLKLGPGQTKSYGEIAEAIGNPRAVRAVGGACGANPIPVLVPCHRILAANRKIGGFSGGLEWKRRLLAKEGVRFLEVYSA